MIVLCTKCRVPHELVGKQYLCKDCKRSNQRMCNTRNRKAWWKLVGSTCQVCGYSKSTAALDMHHRDPSEKLFSIGGKFNAHHPDHCKKDTRLQILLEVEKCNILCSNCHRELHEEENNG